MDKEEQVPDKKSHTLGDSIAIVALVASLLTWILTPTFAERLGALVLAIVFLVYLSYRSLWSREWHVGAKHLCAIMIVLVIGIGGGMQLLSQWRRETQPVSTSTSASVPAPRPSVINQHADDSSGCVNLVAVSDAQIKCQEGESKRHESSHRTP